MRSKEDYIVDGIVESVKIKMMLNSIKKLIDLHGYSPSLKELGNVWGLSSVSSVLHWVRQFEKEGYITTLHNQPRTIRLTKHGEYMIKG